MSNNKLFMEGHELAVVNRYYIWLLNRIDFDSYEDRSKLLQYLHNKEYVWDIWTDENRAEDGLGLRLKFEKETDYLDYSPLNKPCSVLEMLIAFAERIDKDVTDETIKAVANMKPYYAVFRDSSMANDSVATNFDQIFANISPDTIRKVL